MTTAKNSLLPHSIENDSKKQYIVSKLEKLLSSQKQVGRVSVLDVTDYDQTYETSSLWRKVTNPLRLALVKLISYLKIIGIFLFVKHSKMGKRIKRFRTSHLALEIIYTYEWSRTQNRSITDRILTHLLLNFVNAKAARNRLKLVKKELRQAIISLQKRKITIASLGSGSARAVVEVLAELQSSNDDYKFKVVLVDVSENALSYSERLAKKHGVADSVQWIRVEGLLEQFVQNSHDNPPDIVEMVGIMDYFDKIEALDVCSHIYDLLTPSGVLLVSNICRNPEKIFLDRVLSWSMSYRDPKDLAAIVLSSGFKSVNTRIVYEPLKIHGLVVSRKDFQSQFFLKNLKPIA